MKGRGITITNYLLTGDPEGITASFVSNWTGQSMKIPRNSFFETKDSIELNRPGIYLLIGSEEEKPEETLIYIGESNNLFERISTHIRDENKSFFELIITFSSKDDNLTVSHTKYLEKKILDEIFEKSGIKILNRKDGNKINLPKMVQDEMDTYFDNIKILLPTMGYDLFKPNIQIQKLSSISKNNKLFLDVSDIKTSGELVSNGLLVFKGSMMKLSETSSLSNTYSKIRKDLIEKGYVKTEGDKLESVQNYEFSSSSQAGAVILGYALNGRKF